MKARIVGNRELGPGYYKMTLSDVGPVASGEPGQFVMVRGEWGTDPLLGRPFSIARFLEEIDTIEIIYRVAGRGTKKLSRTAAGQPIHLIGPLGRPFPRPDTGRRVILVAGAIGAPPLIALAESIEPRPLLIMGGKTKGDVTFITEDARDLALETVFVTEDGSFGERGSAISALESRARADDLIYACGPNRMLAEINRLSKKIGFEAFVSFEERMACGMGMCLGCAVKGADGEYLLTCKDGPVFDVKQIRWEKI